MEKVAEKIMGMNDRTWMRHTNPWSFWTRMATTPFLFLALWCWVWIGWWAICPIILISLWLWVNPRLFPEPKNKNTWASKGVLGERVYLNRKNIPIPQHHVIGARILVSCSTLLMLIALYGFITADFICAFVGFHASVAMKIWFVDRMSWLFDEMSSNNQEYAQWLD